MSLPAIRAEVVRFSAADDAGRHDPWREINSWLQLFLAGLTEQTRRAYQVDVSEWLAWCGECEVDPLAARYVHARAWAGVLTGQEATKARRLAAASAWCAYLLRNDAMKSNPFLLLERSERPRVDRDFSRTGVPSADDVNVLKAVAVHDGLRTAAIVYLLVYSGMRVGELCGASVSDLTMSEGHHVLQIMGKGRKGRTVPLPPVVYVRVHDYLTDRGALLLPALAGQGGGRSSMPLIATRSGGRIDQPYVFRLIRRLATAAGLPPELVSRLSPHSLRHAFATLNLKAGVPLEEVQDAMGHADPRTTRRYDRRRLDPARHPAYVLARELGAQ